MSMSDTAEINYISKIDFSKGFQYFHVKWPLKDLIKPKRSSIFKTMITDGDRSITFSWSLVVRNSTKDPTNTMFGAFLKSPGKITPVIGRICPSSSNNVLFDRSGLVVLDETYGYGHDVLSSEVNAYPSNGLMLQFWIGVPNAIALGNNSDKLEEPTGGLQDQNLLQKASNDVFLLDHVKMFNRVVGADSDPSSDVSVIIVKKKEEGEEEEELRRYNCHTIFLSNRSDVFERMFALEDWKENSDGRSVRIKDISVRVMETILQYIYTSALPEPTIDHDHLRDIIFAADKYNLKELMNCCVGVLMNKYDWIEDRIEQLILADRHNLAQLKAICIAQLSFGFSTSFSDHAKLKDISTELWSEIMKAMSDRQVKTTDITLSAA